MDSNPKEKIIFRNSSTDRFIGFFSERGIVFRIVIVNDGLNLVFQFQLEESFLFFDCRYSNIKNLIAKFIVIVVPVYFHILIFQCLPGEASVFVIINFGFCFGYVPARIAYPPGIRNWLPG